MEGVHVSLKNFSLLALCGLFAATGCIAKVEKKIPIYMDSTPSDTAETDEVGSDQTDDAEVTLDVPQQDVDSVEPTDTVELVPVESAVLLPAGGHYLLEGGIELLVPAGAVTDDLGVTVEASGYPSATLPDGAEAVTAVWALEPHGTVFAKPITVGIPRLQGSVDVTKWTLLKGFVGGEASFAEAEVVPAWGGPEDSMVYIQTIHFSVVAAALAESGSKPVCEETERCNGKDDDCDGSTDEEPLDLTGNPCLDEGVCEGKVAVTCVEGDWSCDYSQVTGKEDEESSCDGLDNDCDGSVDEGIYGLASEVEGDDCLTSGLCAANQPSAYCAMGVWYCDYSTVPGYQGTIEFWCDGVDNDCDGTVDEGTCEGLEACTENVQCISGLCAQPQGQSGGKVCTFHANSCLVMDGADVVEVTNGATLCTGPLEVVKCESGVWSAAATCATAYSGTFKCDPETNACTAGCDIDSDCIDDGNLCNGTPKCVEGSCELDPLTVITCTGTDCLMATCDPSSGQCNFAPKNDTGPCDDGDKCTVKGVCSNGVCTGQNPVNCNDNKQCTTDSCNQETGLCINDPAPLSGTSCSDGVNCTTDDKCDATGACVGVVNTCADGNACTDDRCVEATGLCTNESAVMEGLGCSDNNACTQNDKCAAGVCLGTAKSCVDTNDCTADGCDSGTGECTHTPTNQGYSCLYPSNGAGAQDPCTPNGSCNSGVCVAGADLCECRSDSDCVAQDNGDKCDGIFRCNLAQAPYECYFDASTVVSCSTSGDTECKKNTCNPGTGLCSMGNVADGTGCNDGNACTVSDKCASGTCSNTQPLVCDDSDPCTLNQCIPASGCSYPGAPNTTSCEDGDPCTIGDKCDGSGGCVSGSPRNPVCDDSNVCTDNTCSPDGQTCVFNPISGCCNLSSECSSPAVCFNHACCTPQCSGKECGDDGCGGTCGSCESWEECQAGICECPTCCQSTATCAYDEVCPTGMGTPVCTAKPRIFHRGFEGEPAGTSGTLPSGMYFATYTSSQNPWKVKNYADGSNCHNGTYVLQYSKSGSLNASGSMSFWHDLPTAAESATSVFSFYLRCPYSATPPAWSLVLQVNDSSVLSIDQSTACTGEYIRYAVDLAPIATGLTKFTFVMTKIAVNPLVTLYLDDIAIHADTCPTWLTCTSFTQSNGTCVAAAPSAGTCFVDGDCWYTNDVSPNFECIKCDPVVNALAWTSDAALCDAGQTCDPSYTLGGCKTL